MTDRDPPSDTSPSDPPDTPADDVPTEEPPADGEESPIGGEVLLVTAAEASVPGRRVPELVRRVQADLRPRLGEYRQRYETVHETADACYLLADPDHWEDIGDRLGLDDRETDAVRRAHTEQLLSAGRREDREAEFEAAVEIRDAIVIGR